MFNCLFKMFLWYLAVLSYRETSQPSESSVNNSAVSDGIIKLSFVDTSLLTRPEAKDDFSAYSTTRPNSSYARSKTDSIAESDLTSSTVIRETDVRFLNDFAVRKKPVSAPAARVHRVNVVVPTAHNIPSASDSNPVPATNVLALANDVQNVVPSSVPSQPKLKVTFEDMKPSDDAEPGRRVGTTSQSSADIGEMLN